MLEKQRKKIDAIDRQLVALFEERTSVVEEVAQIKLQHQMPILDSGREEQVIAKVQSYLTQPELEQEVKEWFVELMRISREHQQKWMNEQ